MGMREFFIYDESGKFANPLAGAMPDLPITNDEEFGVDPVCETVVRQPFSMTKSVCWDSAYDVNISIPAGTHGIIVCDEFSLPISNFVKDEFKNDIKIIDISDIVRRFKYSSVFRDVPTESGTPLILPERESKARYVPNENTGKMHHPPLCQNYVITDAKEQTDTDGSVLGVALGKFPGSKIAPFVTWTYTYFPESNYFNGFNNGNYFSNEAAAICDFDKRCDMRLYNLANTKEPANINEEASNGNEMEL